MINSLTVDEMGNCEKKDMEFVQAERLNDISLFHYPNIPQYILDEKGDIIFINNCAIEIYGHTKKFYIGKNFLTLAAPAAADVSQIEAKIKKAFDGEPQQVEFGGLIKNNAKLPKRLILFSCIYLKNKSILCLEYNIAENIISEHNLKISENRYRIIGEMISDFAYSCVHNENKGFQVDWITDSFYSVTGFTEEVLLKHKCWLFCAHPDERNQILKEFNALVPGQELVKEFRIIDSDNNIHWLNNYVRCVLDENDSTVFRLFGAARDITERKTAIEKLREKEDIISKINDCLLCLSSDHNQNIADIVALCGKLLHADCALYNRLDGEMLNTIGCWNAPPDFKKEDSPQGHLCYDVINGKAGNTLIVTDLPNSTYNETDPNVKTYGLKSYIGYPVRFAGVNIGSLCVVYVNEYIPGDEDLKILGILSVAIAQEEERQQVETELRTAKEKAEEMSRLKSSFLANMSHELRTPMHGILGMAEILNSQSTNNETKEMTDMILTSGRRLLNTLNMILTLARIEANKQEIRLKSIKLFQTVMHSVRLYTPMALEKNLSIKFVSISDDIEFLTDPQLFDSILNNLIDNAIKYTETGGISVYAGKEIRNGEESVVIKVEDTGIGITPENQQLVFDEFRQVSEGYDRAFEGAGLGLSIIRRYIDLLNGSITLTSLVDRGSTFTVILPNHPKQKEEKIVSGKKITEDISIPGKLGEKVKIILVDDDQITINIVNIWLRNFYDFDYAKDVAAAIEKINNNDYKAILLDINLRKGESGITLLKEIRKKTAYRNTPVIACTAYAMPGDENKLIFEGFDHYISKPFQKKEIFELLEFALKSKIKTV